MPIVITNRHIQALKFAPIASSIVSVIGSTCLIYSISTVKKKRTPLLRLLLCLSIADVPQSINWSLGTIPNIEGYAIGAKGNEATCTASGFVSYGIGGLQPFYNASIMIYFLLTIRYGWKPQDFEKTHTEKAMHALSAGVPIVSGIVLAIIGYINPTPLALGRCFVQAFPPDCDVTEGVECQRGQHARIVRWTLALGPYLAVFVFLFFSVFVIAWTFRQQARRMRRYSEANSVRIQKRVIVESLSYGSIFFLTYFFGLFMMVSNLVPVMEEGSDRTWLYPIMMLREIFYPLQGFFNCMIYVYGQKIPSNGSTDTFPRIADHLRDTAKLMSKSVKDVFRSTSSLSIMENDDIPVFGHGSHELSLGSDVISVDVEEGGKSDSSDNTKTVGTEESTLSFSGKTAQEGEVTHHSKENLVEIATNQSI